MGKRSPEEVKRRLERLKTINKLLQDDYQAYLETMKDPDADLIYSFEEPLKNFSDDELLVFAEGQGTGMDKEIEYGEIYHNYHNAMLELADKNSTRRPLDPNEGNDLQRIAGMLMDVSYVDYEPGSSEYEAIVEKNRKMVEDLKNPEKRKEAVEKVLRNLLSIDITPAITGSDEEKTRFCKEHPVEVDQMFLIKDFTSYYSNQKSNNGMEIDEGLLQACREKENIFQNVGAIGALAEAYSNEFFPFVKGKSYAEMQAIVGSLPERVVSLSETAQAALAQYGIEIPEKDFCNMAKKVTLISGNQMIFDDTEKKPYEAFTQNNMLGPGAMKWVAVNQDGAVISFEDTMTIMNNDGKNKSNKITFYERTPEMIAYLEKGTMKPLDAYTGRKISFEGYKGVESFELYSKEQVQEANQKFSNYLNTNNSRAEKAAEYSDEGKSYNEVLGDYFGEMKRVKGVFDNHLQTVFGKDGGVSADNCMPAVFKLAAMEKAFLSSLPSKEEREAATTAFETIKSSIQDFAGYTAEAGEGNSVKDFNTETLLNPLSRIDNAVSALQSIAERQTELSSENKELLTGIASNLDKLKLKNAPDNPEKDMLGIGKKNVIDACSEKYLFPIKVGRLLASHAYSTDGQFPKDPKGYNAFQKLKDQLDAFGKKAGAISRGDKDVSITKDDYINIAAALKNVAENGALFASDSPNGLGMGEKNNSNLNQVITYSKDMLDNMVNQHPDIAEIKNYARLAGSGFAMNVKKNYQELRKTAFSGDVTKNKNAKTAWQRMITLKNQFKELDNQFQKDRMSMMVVNENFCLQEVSAAEMTLNNIKKDEVNALINKEDRLMTAEDSLSQDNRVNYVAAVRNDAIMIQMFGIGLSRERQTNTDPKATEEERFINGNDALKSIGEKDAFEKLKYAQKRTEAFLSRRKDIKELDPKMNESLSGSTKHLKETIGFEAYKTGNDKLNAKIDSLVSRSTDSLGMNFERISSIIKKGSDEANALSSQIKSYADKAKNGEIIGIDDKMMLFKATKDYLHKKSSIPFTQFGKNRVDAATEILGKVGIDLLSDSKNQASFNTVRTEMEIEMLRNPKFRQEITGWAKGVIDKNVAQSKKLSEGNPELFAAAELLVFGKAADAAMPDPKKNYVDTKLDKPEKMKMITGKVANISAAAKGLLENTIASSGLAGLSRLAEAPELSKQQSVQTIL